MRNLLLTSLAATAAAFAPARLAAPARRSSPATTSLRVLPDPAFIADAAHHMSYHASSVVDQLDHLMAGTNYVPDVADRGWAIPGWYMFRDFVEGSLIGLHGFLVDCGVEENSYGYAIAIFTFCARSLTAPLLFIQYSSTEKVKALKPYQDEIKERYPNNEKMQSVLTSRLFEDTEVNPLAGCLPTLSQIPIFIALYRSILSLVQQNLLDEKFLWLPSLAGPQYGTGRGVGWLTDGWVNDIPALGWHDTIAFCVIPLVLVLSQATTQAIMTPAPDPDEKLDAGTQRTQRILKYLPLVIGWFSANVPAGLGVYWITSNTFSTSFSLAVKQYYKMNPPELEWDFFQQEEAAKSALSTSVISDLPKDMNEALDEARRNCRPVRSSIRNPPMAAGVMAAGAPAALPVTAMGMSTSGDA